MLISTNPAIASSRRSSPLASPVREAAPDSVNIFSRPQPTRFPRALPLAMAGVAAAGGALGASSILARGVPGVATAVALAGLGTFGAGLLLSYATRSEFLEANTPALVMAGVGSTVTGAVLGALTGSMGITAAMVGGAGLLAGLHGALN